MITRIAVATLAAVVLMAGAAWAEGEAPPAAELRRDAAKVVEKANSEQDLLRVYISYAHRVDGKWVCVVAAVWGDLDRKIDGYGPEYYSNWSGAIRVSDGHVKLIRKIAFDDRSGKDPTEGSGADKITGVAEREVVWGAGVVGAVDGLVFKVVLNDRNDQAAIKVGRYVVRIPILTR